MEFQFPDDFWAALSGPSVPLYRDVPALATELDLSLIRLMYESIAGQTMCARCGEALGRGLHLEAWSGAATWQVRVITHCSSWRRHRHTAVVTEVSGGLRLGPLMSGQRAA